MKNNSNVSQTSTVPIISVEKDAYATDEENFQLSIVIEDSDGLREYWVKLNNSKLDSNDLNITFKNKIASKIVLSPVLKLKKGENLVEIYALDTTDDKNTKVIRIFTPEVSETMLHTIQRSLYFILKRIFQSF